jgi:hypothetical protein
VIKQLIFCVVILLFLSACRGQQPYLETFDAPGTWRVGDDLEASGQVVDGVYRFAVEPYNAYFWTTAGAEFSNGVFSVEATQVEGPLNPGFGMLLRVDDQQDAFYMFLVSGDGWVLVARCFLACSGDNRVDLINEGWFESAAVNQGLGETNELTVEANAGNLVFYVNEQLVGAVTDVAVNGTDIGLIVRTIDTGDVVVEFDNFSVTPLD